MPDGADPIELRAITQDNFDALIALRVADAQRDFVNSNVESIAWGFVAPECRLFAIYAEGSPVGMATYAYVPSDGRCWVVHLMVDERSQGHGVGRAALEQLLQRMTDESAGAAIAVAVSPDNAPAIRLYEEFGFVDTGRRQNGELILRRAARGEEAADVPGG